MSNLFIQKGNILDYLNAGPDLAVNTILTIGALLGITMDTIPSGQVGAVGVDGVWSLPKLSTDVMAVGDVVDWDASTGEFNSNIGVPATGDITNGATVVEAAGSGDTTVKVKINAPFGTLN